jgi:hypothetical protein
MSIVAGPREVLTANTSTAITATILLPTSGNFKGKPIVKATFQATVQQIYVIWDGTDATSDCILLGVGDSLIVEGTENLKYFRALNAVAGGKLLVLPEYRV